MFNNDARDCFTLYAYHKLRSRCLLLYRLFSHPSYNNEAIQTAILFNLGLPGVTGPVGAPGATGPAGQDCKL